MAGELETETYPSGRAVTTCYDSGGRVATVSGQATSTSPTVPYATVNTYAPHGGITQMKLGNSLYEGASYNLRLQAASMTLGTSAGGSDLWSITNDYGLSLNNANLLSQAITAPNMAGTLKQYFTYDPLNRLQVAVENPAAGNVTNPVCPDSASQWCQQFSYDTFSNRTIVARTNTGVAMTEPPAFNSASNQISGNNWGFDGAGRLTQDPLSFYAYDSENRMTAFCTTSPCVAQPAAGRTLYGYDGNGQRVTRQTPDGTVTTYAYDAMGDLAAEYASPSTTPAVSGTVYLTTDHLGSTRVVTDTSTAHVVARHDFRPFGEDISFNASSPRQGVLGYGLDAGVRQQFTAQERDSQSGLDDFGARFYGSITGRFAIPDAPGADQHPLAPQSWNLYTYVGNSPLVNVDPTGRSCITTTVGGRDSVGDNSDGLGCPAAGVAPLHKGEKMSDTDAVDITPDRVDTNAKQGSLWQLLTVPQIPRYVPNDKPLSEDARKVLTQVYQTTVTLNSSCTIAGFYLASGAVGAGGAAVANGSEIVTAVVDNYPTGFHKVLSWVARQGSMPARRGGMALALSQVYEAAKQFCSKY